MILYAEDLPSGGRFLLDKSSIRFRPLTFLEIISYMEDKSGNTIKNYMRDLHWLFKLDPNTKKQSLYDLDYLIFMMKASTISENKEFISNVNCPVCGAHNHIRFELGDFKFKDFDEEEIVEKVALGDYNYKVKVPTIETFYRVLQKYALYKKTDSADVVKLISLFPEFETMPNDIENAVLGASREDIAVLHFLESKYLSSVIPLKRTCDVCQKEGGMAIGVDSLVADLFRDVLLNCQPDESKIQFRKIR